MDEESTTSNLRVKWMSSNEAAQRLGVTTATLYRFIDEGRLPAYQMGRVIRLKESELEDFERTCLIEPGSLSHLIQE